METEEDQEQGVRNEAVRFVSRLHSTSIVHGNSTQLRGFPDRYHHIYERGSPRESHSGRNASEVNTGIPYQSSIRSQHAAFIPISSVSDIASDYYVGGQNPQFSQVSAMSIETASRQPAPHTLSRAHIDVCEISTIRKNKQRRVRRLRETTRDGKTSISVRGTRLRQSVLPCIDEVLRNAEETPAAGTAQECMPVPES